jgi:uncharacterized DUF497 family protein
MKNIPIVWDSKKNEFLIEQRGISFEDIEDIIKKDKIISIKDNKSENFPNQKILIFAFDNYIWTCPCLVEKHQIVLKTAFPNRKFNSLYSQYL